jgi:hypothetical protein
MARGIDGGGSSDGFLREDRSFVVELVSRRLRVITYIHLYIFFWPLANATNSG